MKKNVKASYLNGFKCISGVCEDNCCIGWNVEIDKKTYAKYEKIKDKELIKCFKRYVYENDFSYDKNVDYALVELEANKHCPFLNQEKLCRIQAKLGENYLSNVCSSYPRLINEVDGILEYSATISCPEIARLALGVKDGIEFEQNDAGNVKDNIISISVNTKKEDSPVLVKYLQELRGLTMGILKSRDCPLWERMLIIGIVFRKIQELINLNKAEEIPEQIVMFSQKMDHRGFRREVKSLPVNQFVQLGILKEISDKFNDSNEIDSKKYLSFINEFYKGIGAGKRSVEKESSSAALKVSNAELSNRYNILYKDFYKPFMNEKDYILENYLVNFVFQSLFPMTENNQPFESYANLVIRYSLIKCYLIGISGFRNGLTETIVIDFIQSFSKGLEHNYNFFEKIGEYMQQKNYDTMEYMSILIRN